jgi:hypothetical protein
MTHRLHPGWRARVLAMAAGLGCALSVLAQDTPFAGRWLPEQQPGTAAAAYPVLTIVLQNEKPGTMYVNGRGTKFIAGVTGSLPTYLLKLRANACAGGADAVRIIYPTVYGSRQIEVLEYVNGKVVSARRMHRKQ